MFEPVHHNADKIIDDTFYFYHRDPQFIFEFDKEISINKVLIQFNLDLYNIDAYTLYESAGKQYETTIKKLENDIDLFYNRKMGKRIKDVFCPPKRFE